jgi:hypothetical protein
MNNGIGFGASVGGGAPLAASGGSGDDLRDSVLNYIRDEGERLEVGANVQKCIQLLTSSNGRFTESGIRKAIDDLAAEGHIYSTINEDNYKFAM